ncbi:MAG: DUF3786 domain-containing protein [Actinomycetota bacterium]|nr:DUF3786 domain-containing protein [Actinomycetota bacterium]
MGDDALKVAREKAAGLEPAAAAARIGAEWDAAGLAFRLPFFGTLASVAYPAFEVFLGEAPSPPHVAALLVYYLALSDGSTPSGTWISFADLPDASFYVTAFRGYTSAQIVRRFAPQPEQLAAAAERLGAESLPGLADRAWRIPALPRVPVALLWWDADDEFGTRAELLFDSTASHHLTTDGCAILGSWLTSLLTRQPPVPREHPAAINRP